MFVDYWGGREGHQVQMGVSIWLLFWLTCELTAQMLCIIIAVSSSNIHISSSRRPLLSENLEVLQWFHHSQTCLEASWDIEERDRARVVVVVLSLSLFLWDEESLSIAVGHWNVHKWSCRMSSKYQVVDAVRSIKIFHGVLFYNRLRGEEWNWVKSSYRISL